jgi:hypothetical protein
MSFETAHPDCTEHYDILYVGRVGSFARAVSALLRRRSPADIHVPTSPSSRQARTTRAVSTPHHVLPPGPTRVWRVWRGLGTHVGCTHFALALRTAQPSALLSVLVSHACCTSGSSALAETADSGEMAFACAHVRSAELSVYAGRITARASTRAARR